jgi:hypothetical protein
MPAAVMIVRHFSDSAFWKAARSAGLPVRAWNPFWA